MGIGDWGLGIGPNPQSPIPNPQSPIPNNINHYNNNLFTKSILINYSNTLYSNLLIINNNNNNQINQIYKFNKKTFIRLDNTMVDKTETKPELTKTDSITTSIKSTTKKEEKPFERFAYTKDETDELKSKYGVMDLITSCTDPEVRYKTEWINLVNLEEHVGKQIKCRVRLQKVKATGKRAFLELRDGIDTAQGILSVEEGKISSQMVKFSGAVPHESLIDVTGTVLKVENLVEKCSVKTVEISVESIFVVVSCQNVLPFQMEDAGRKGNIDAEEADEKDVKKKLTKEEKKALSKEDKAKLKEEEAKEAKESKEKKRNRSKD